MKGVRRRGKTWTAYWELPAKLDLETGKPRIDEKTGKPERHQGTKGGFETAKAARLHLATVVTQVAAGTYVEPARTALATFMLEEWLPGISATVRPLTIAKYRSVTRQIVKRDVGAVALRDLSPGHLNALYAQMEADGLSIATRRVTHATLSRALRDAMKWGKITRNPASAADPPALPRPKAQSWTDSELCRFLAHVESDRLYPLWMLAATTGMRRGELLGLPWRCVDLDGGTLRVEQQLIPLKGGVTFGPPKSARSERTIALDPETIETLRHHLAAQKLERDLAGPAYQDGDLVFADELGRALYPSRLGESFVKARKAAGIPTGTLHIMRHTCATIALTERVPLHVVARRLGDDPKTVLATYAHLLPSSDAEAAAAVAAVIAARRESEPALS